MFVDETALLNAVLEKAVRLFAIAPGQIILLRIPREQLNDAEYIAMHCLGRLFSAKAGQRTTATITLDELVENTGIPKEQVSARLSDLKNIGAVRNVGRGEYEAVLFGMEPLLHHVLSDKLSAVSRSPARTLLQDERQEQLPTYLQTLPEIERGNTAIKTILNALSTDWARSTPRTAAELSKVLEKNGINFSRGTMAGTLHSLVSRGNVKMTKDGRACRYQLIPLP